MSREALTRKRCVGLCSPFSTSPRGLTLRNLHLDCGATGHVSGVTDARFSGLGDRILTASMEDGTARIYSWGPRFSNVKHVVLKVRSNIFFQSLATVSCAAAAAAAATVTAKFDSGGSLWTDVSMRFPCCFLVGSSQRPRDASQSPVGAVALPPPGHQHERG